MNRRALGRGRVLIGFGAIIAAAGLFLPWWLIERTNQAALSGNGLQEVGLVIFLAAMTTLAVLTLPFASRDGASGIDRAATYILLGLSAIGAFAFRLTDISSFAGLEMPTVAPGLWLTAVGLVVYAWGVVDVLTSNPEKR